MSVEVIYVRLPEHIKDKIKEKADAVGLSLSTYVRVLIIKALNGGNDGNQPD